MSVPSSFGKCGKTPEWATTGRLPSTFSNAPFTARSSTLRLNVGSCCPTAYLNANLFGFMAADCSTSTATGTLWPHQITIDGWCPSRSTAFRACRIACLRTLRAYPHCSGMSCHSNRPALSAASYSSGRPMCAWTRIRSSPASRARSTSRAISSGAASPSSIRDGPWFDPLRKMRSPLIDMIQSRMVTDRMPACTSRR